MADLNETLGKLNESIGQHSATALINIQLPSFGGLPNEDIHKFLKDFKAATITCNEELRCLALDKALIGCAHTWAKKHIKDEIKKGDWQEAKKKFRKRFIPPDENLRYLEKLSKMKYNSSEITLSCYVEAFADTYSKAHKDAFDKDIIRSLRINLPHDIIRNLNVLSESWAELDNLDSFMKIVDRLERSILPYDSKPSSVHPDYAKLTAVIEGLEKKITTQQAQIKAEQQEQKEVIAAVTRQTSQRSQQERGYKRAHDDGDNQPRTDNRYSKRFNNNPKPNSDAAYDRQETKSRAQLQQEYEQTHGKVPGPCWTCGDNHFNKHCPYRPLKY